MKTIKAFFSGLFAVLSDGQSNIRNYYGAKFLASLSMKLADEPYTFFMAHSVTAKTYNLRKNDKQTLQHIGKAFKYYEEPSFEKYPETVKMERKLLSIQEKIM